MCETSWSTWYSLSLTSAVQDQACSSFSLDCSSVWSHISCSTCPETQCDFNITVYFLVTRLFSHSLSTNTLTNVELSKRQSVRKISILRSREKYLFTMMLGSPYRMRNASYLLSCFCFWLSTEETVLTSIVLATPRRSGYQLQLHFVKYYEHGPFVCSRRKVVSFSDSTCTK